MSAPTTPALGGAIGARFGAHLGTLSLRRKSPLAHRPEPLPKGYRAYELRSGRRTARVFTGERVALVCCRCLRLEDVIPLVGPQVFPGSEDSSRQWSHTLGLSQPASTLWRPTLLGLTDGIRLLRGHWSSGLNGPRSIVIVDRHGCPLAPDVHSGLQMVQRITPVPVRLFVVGQPGGTLH